MVVGASHESGQPVMCSMPTPVHQTAVQSTLGALLGRGMPAQHQQILPPAMGHQLQDFSAGSASTAAGPHLPSGFVLPVTSHPATPSPWSFGKGASGQEFDPGQYEEFLKWQRDRQAKQPAGKPENDEVRRSLEEFRAEKEKLTIERARAAKEWAPKLKCVDEAMRPRRS